MCQQEIGNKNLQGCIALEPGPAAINGVVFFFSCADKKTIMLLLCARLVIACTLVLVSDVIWLGWITKTMATEAIVRVQGAPLRLNLRAALAASLLVSTGLVVLCMKEEQWKWETQLLAAFYGMVVFGVFDATNLACFENWSLNFALVDVSYGVVLCSATYGFVTNVIH